MENNSPHETDSCEPVAALGCSWCWPVARAGFGLRLPKRTLNPAGLALSSLLASPTFRC